MNIMVSSWKIRREIIEKIDSKMSDERKTIKLRKKSTFYLFSFP